MGSSGAKKIVQEGRLEVPVFGYEVVAGGKGERCADSITVSDGAGDATRIIVDMCNFAGRRVLCTVFFGLTDFHFRHVLDEG